MTTNWAYCDQTWENCFRL